MAQSESGSVPGVGCGTGDSGEAKADQCGGYGFALGAVLLLAVGLRFWGLTTQSYWLDELFSAGVSDPDNSYATVWTRTVADVHPPLYQSLLWLWYQAFGYTEASGRALSAVIGSLGVLALYLLGKELLGRQVGLYAAVLASTNLFLLRYAQELRSYSLLFLLAVLSFLFLARIIERHRHGSSAAYLGCTIALVYTHYFGFVLVAAQWTILLLAAAAWRDQRCRLLLLMLGTVAVVLVASLPLLGPLTAGAARQTTWIPGPSPWFVVEYLRIYLASRYLCLLLGGLALYGAVRLLASGAGGAGEAGGGQTRERRVAVLLLVWVGIGYLLPYLRSLISAPILTPRNTIIVLPALLLWVAYGIAALRRPVWIAAALAVVVLLSGHAIWANEHYSSVSKDQWRELLVEVKHTGPAVPVYACWGEEYRAYTRLLRLNLEIRDVGSLAAQTERGEAPPCFWLLDAHEQSFDRLPPMAESDRFRVVRSVALRGAWGTLYAQGDGAGTWGCE